MTDRPASEQDTRELLEEKLEFLRTKEAITADPEQAFQLHKAIQQTEAKLAALDPTPAQARQRRAPIVDLDHLPLLRTEHFLGRGPELTQLDQAWASGRATSVVELSAPGGTGKTALVKRWLDGLRSADPAWSGAVQVFGWSFYSQGTTEDR